MWLVYNHDSTTTLTVHDLWVSVEGKTLKKSCHIGMSTSCSFVVFIWAMCAGKRSFGVTAAKITLHSDCEERCIFALTIYPSA